VNGLYKTIVSRRTVRFFKDKKVPPGLIKKVVNAARLAPSAANLQFLEYLAIGDKALRQEVFNCASWAGYVFPDRVPPEGKRPAGFIVILVNHKKSSNPDQRDIGAAAQNMLLALESLGLAGCWIGKFDRPRLSKILDLPANCNIDSLVAFGYPAERPKLEEDADNIKYWLDKNNRLHVPKRPLKDIMRFNCFRSQKPR